MHSEQTVLENAVALKIEWYETCFGEIYIEGERGEQGLGC
jgi:hypothetical protein